MLYEQLLTEKNSDLQRIANTFGVETKNYKGKDELVSAILTKQSKLIMNKRESARIPLSQEDVVPLLPVQVNVDSLTKFAELAKGMREELEELSADALLEVASRLGYTVDKSGSYGVIAGNPVPTTSAAITLLIMLQLGIVPSQ